MVLCERLRRFPTFYLSFSENRAMKIWPSLSRFFTGAMTPIFKGSFPRMNECGALTDAWIDHHVTIVILMIVGEDIAGMSSLKVVYKTIFFKRTI